MFNFLKKKKDPHEGLMPTFDELYCMSTNKFITQETDNEKNVIKEVSEHLESMKYEEFINAIIEVKDTTIKITNSELQSKVNKLQFDCIESTLQGHFIYTKKWLLGPEGLSSSITAYRLTLVPGKPKYLQILHIGKEQNKYPCNKPTREGLIQFVDLDKDEYELLKPLHERMKDFKNPKLDEYISSFQKAMVEGLFATEKRKTYPINNYYTFLCFKK